MRSWLFFKSCVMEVEANFMLWMLVQTANNNEVSMGNSGMLPIT